MELLDSRRPASIGKSMVYYAAAMSLDLSTRLHDTSASSLDLLQRRCTRTRVASMEGSLTEIGTQTLEHLNFSHKY